MRRLVWAFTGRTYHIVGNLMSRLIYSKLFIPHLHNLFFNHFIQCLFSFLILWNSLVTFVLYFCVSQPTLYLQSSSTIQNSLGNTCTVFFVLVTPFFVCICPYLYKTVYVRLTLSFVSVTPSVLLYAFVLIYTKQYMVDLYCLLVSITPSFLCICSYLNKKKKQ